MISKPPLNTPSYDIKTMRPPTYPNLGDMMMTRMPTDYISQLRELLSELDRLGENNDPADILSNIIDRLSDMDS